VRHGDACIFTGHCGKALAEVGLGDHVPNRAQAQPFPEVVLREQYTRWDHYRPELTESEQDVPDRRKICEHDEHAVPAAHAVVLQPAGYLVRPH
jgi:hypothetical protein